MTFILLIILSIGVTVVYFSKNAVEDKKNAVILEENRPQVNGPQESTASERLQEPIRNALAFDTAAYREDGVTFTITAEEYIAAYNELYRADYGEELILPLEQWVCFSYENSPFSPYETNFYRFQTDVRWSAEPTISLYIPADSEFIQEITFDFDDHGYTEKARELFTRECFYGLKVLFPEYEDSQITDVFTELFERGYEPYTYVSFFSYLDHVELPFLFYKDHVGLFSCSAGQTIHICVMPVTQEVLDTLAGENVEIVDLGA